MSMLLLIFNYFIYRELEDSVIDVFLTVLLMMIMFDNFYTKRFDY
jgi:hypothetical protein